VKVLNQNGSGWSSAIAHGLLYVAGLKQGPLAGSPIVVNMSLGGTALDPIEQAAIDYAIGKGVIVVASAGNQGNRGMGFPGAYAPVISVAATGWVGEFSVASWWRNLDVGDPTNFNEFYITDFSSRELQGQDLDVAAPGSYVVGPYQVNSGTNKLSYYYLSGTSMASPHVAGIVALMLQKNSALTASQAEAILENTAIPLNPGCQYHPYFQVNYCWGPGQDPSASIDADGHGMVDATRALTATR
jgi:subtilisin family serine protease